MSEVKWIKICTDIFDDEKISLIDSMPERDGIIVIWFKLLCMAGKQNNGGVFMMNDKIAYTDEMLATIFRRPLNTVRLALHTFEQFGMVDIINNAYTIPNWEKHQSLDKLEAAKEKNRLRVAAHREKQKQLAQCNDYSNVTVTPCNALDKEEDKDNRGNTNRQRFVPPTLEEVTAYVEQRKSNVIPQAFIDFYEAKGWMVGKNKMKDWKAACRNAEGWDRWDRIPRKVGANGIHVNNEKSDLEGVF